MHIQFPAATYLPVYLLQILVAWNTVRVERSMNFRVQYWYRSHAFDKRLGRKTFTPNLP